MVTRHIEYRIKEKYILLFLIEWLLINCFAMVELIWFYVFFEALLIPVFVTIGIWGSKREKISASYNFFLYSLVGSLMLLTVIIIFFLLIGTTNIFIIKSFIFHPFLESLLFIFLFLSFSFKIPMIPFHLWLPKAHVEAPTTGSVLLAGIVLKLGSYALLRFTIFLFPVATLYFKPLIIAIATVSIIFSSFSVLRQIDLKKLIAYSSIAHMNYLVCGLFLKNVYALTGSLLLQLSHGLSSSGLFIMIGFLYDRFKSRNVYYLRSLSVIMPFYMCAFLLFSLANCGFPLTINFMAELLIFIGLFSELPSIALIILISIFLSTIYSFILFTRLDGAFQVGCPVFTKRFYDLTRREFYTVLPIISLIIFLDRKSVV